MSPYATKTLACVQCSKPQTVELAVERVWCPNCAKSDRCPPNLAQAAEDLYQALLLVHLVMDKFPETYQDGLYQISAARAQVVEALGKAEGENRS